MTETGISTMNPVEGEFRPGSVGKAIEGSDLEIRDSDGRRLPPERRGRLWVRSPGNFIGYWDSPDATGQALVDGWLDTGDVMSRDTDGYLWFDGRQQQTIVRDGSNFTPQEVENALTQHPPVALAGAIGVPDPAHGENVRACVPLKPGALASGEEELIAFARALIGSKAPADIVFLDEMLLSPSGKVDRAALRRRLAE
jgi:acyl-CoA synthetase (AMP-forming)/AMP-acid ligase II